MKKNIIIIFASMTLIVSSCQKTTETQANVDNITLIKEVTESEIELFALSKNGKINEAFTMHKNNEAYRNILDGVSRSYFQMDSLIKSFANQKIDKLQYDVSARDFLVINSTNVLETVDANRKLISTADSIIENRPVTISILWTKDNQKWNVSYIHGSYKLK